MRAGSADLRHAPPDGHVAADAGVDDGPADAPLDAAVDAAPDAPADAACPTPGPEDLVSGVTPAATRSVQLTGNGNETMALWSLGSRSVWAEYDAGGVVTNGDIGAWPNTGTLSVVGNRFVANNHNELRVFDGTAWNTFPFRNQIAAVSGSSVLGLDGGNATIFDRVAVCLAGGDDHVEYHARRRWRRARRVRRAHGERQHGRRLGRSVPPHV